MQDIGTTPTELRMDEDETHPANQILNLDDPGPPNPKYQGSSYEPFSLTDLGSKPTPHAQVPVALRAKALGAKVDAGDASKAPLIPMRHEKDADSVLYIAKDNVRARREAYEVSMGQVMKRGLVSLDPGKKHEPPVTFDTAAIKKAFLGKSVGGEAFSARLWETEAQKYNVQDAVKEWDEKSLIWVCTTEKGRLGGVFYSNVCRPGTFHHSSFTSGGGLLGAGEWIVEAGKLLKISANSGHYMPTLGEFHRAVLFMRDAWNQDTEVMLFNQKSDNWEYVPVTVFQVDMNVGGKYLVHPGVLNT
jgi:hypothetical protein